MESPPRKMMGKINDDIVELRFSDIFMDTEELISDILSEELEGIADNDYVDAVTGSYKNGAGAAEGPRTASRMSAITLKKDSDGRPSVFSVRPSLMSMGMSDKLLEGIMKQSSLRSVLSGGTTTSSVMADSFSSPLLPMAAQTTQMQMQTQTQAQTNPLFTIPMASQDGDNDNVGDNVGVGTRFSISANPSLFGGGGTPITMDENSMNDMSMLFSTIDPSVFEQFADNNDGSIRQRPNKRPHSMRFSVSRRALNMFDDEDFGDNHDSSSSTDSEDDDEEPKPVAVVSNELRQTYLNETENVERAQEEALAKEIENLTFGNKEIVNFEVHGIPHMGNLNEETANIDGYLQQLEEELRNTTTNNGDAIREAQNMNPNYVNSKEFRLMFLRMFLRGDNNNNAFDVVQQAAAKMVLHFSMKKTIFGGGEILGRDVRLSDLSKDDRAAMDSGAWQTMPDRDVAGRVVVFYAPGQRVFKTIENWLRAMWYMLCLIPKDVENQKSGMVFVLYLRGFTDQRDSFEQARMINMVRDAIPEKFVGLHYCYNDESMKALVTAQKVHFLTRNQRSHLRDHLASHDEICFRLETYGIHIDKQIILENGHLGMSWYNQWIELRKSQEAEAVASGNITNTIEATILPKKFDVLFGRGRDTREHCGNLRCAHLVEMHQLEYERCRKIEKTALAERIVEMVKQCDGRFLKKDRKKGWLEVPDNKAREKVSHFFRQLRTITSNNNNNADVAAAVAAAEDKTDHEQRSTPCPSSNQLQSMEDNGHDAKHAKT